MDCPNQGIGELITNRRDFLPTISRQNARITVKSNAAVCTWVAQNFTNPLERIRKIYWTDSDKWSRGKKRLKSNILPSFVTSLITPSLPLLFLSLSFSACDCYLIIFTHSFCDEIFQPKNRHFNLFKLHVKYRANITYECKPQRQEGSTWIEWDASGRAVIRSHVPSICLMQRTPEFYLTFARRYFKHRRMC